MGVVFSLPIVAVYSNQTTEHVLLAQKREVLSCHKTRWHRNFTHTRIHKSECFLLYVSYFSETW